MRNFSRTVQLKHTSSGSIFFVMNVYGPPTWDSKDEFCNELAALKGVCNGLWVICGDFNVTKNQQEIRGRPWSSRLMGLFFDLLNELEMIDLPLGNQKFTWSNMQSNPTMAKLDHFLISTKWNQAFPLSKVVAVSRITSDHSPILLSTREKLVSHVFIFEKV